ncbi:4Fe-4S dicluster domain-containing protein, partial [Treponema pedis]|uniref:4Fe-4S dicluster domain-containing protein n=1 Tax=Treponema pedis TaxID=409322 RepID=UPI00046573C1
MEQVYIEKEECCGCTACYAICPTHAISMETDEKGFQYPVIDQSICIDCGLCKKVCRFSKPIDNEFDIQQFFALKHRDPEVLKNSQSGGAFTVFSDYILENKGSVFGAFFDKDNFYIYHTKAETEEARNLQRGSKYVQSDLNDCFLSVKKDLQVGKKVLFSGTPCQCDGLISFLVKSKVDTKDLYVIDLICHGVPSQKIFRDY